ncbi:hypothetical protein L7F22_020322 [Adiantum nelumboides]|nr:hypothetical protein [Adiantum nelumboides]
MWEEAEAARKKDAKEEAEKRVQEAQKAAFGSSSSSKSPPNGVTLLTKYQAVEEELTYSQPYVLLTSNSHLQPIKSALNWHIHALKEIAELRYDILNKLETMVKAKRPALLDIPSTNTFDVYKQLHLDSSLRGSSPIFPRMFFAMQSPPLANTTKFSLTLQYPFLEEDNANGFDPFLRWRSQAEIASYVERLEEVICQLHSPDDYLWTCYMDDSSMSFEEQDIDELDFNLANAFLEPDSTKDEELEQVFPLLVHGKAKRWFDGLHDEVKTNGNALEKAFLHKYVPDVQLHEVTKKLDGLKQRLDGSALHEDVCNKVKVDGPIMYANAVAYARVRTKKLLKKQQVIQGMSNAIMSKPVEVVAMKTQPMLESFPVVQQEPRVLWLQRDGAISMPKMPTKEVQRTLGSTRGQRVRFADKAKEIPDLETDEEVEADSSSSMDTDTSSEIESSIQECAIVVQLVQSFSRKDEVVLVVEEEQVFFRAHEKYSQIVASSKPSKEARPVSDTPRNSQQRTSVEIGGVARPELQERQVGAG